MRTKRFLTTTAAMLVMLAIIGSGFSFWFFGTSNSVTGSQGLTDDGKDVTQLIAVGSITAADAFKIEFDQTEEGRNQYGNNVDLGSHDATEGIHLVFADGADMTANYTLPTNGVDQVDSKIQRTFTVTITTSNTLATYFNVTTSDTAWGSAVKTTGTAPSTETTYVFTSTTATEFDWSKVTFTYINEPANVEAYNTFKSAVEAATISVTYNVTVGSVA